MKNTVLTIAVLMVSSFGISQEINDTLKTKGPSFGFNLGLNHSALYNSNDTELLAIENALGFRLGIIASFPLGENWAFSPKAELSFNNGRIIENNITYRVDPYNLDFMAHFKHSYKGYTGIARPFFYFGPNLRVPLEGEFSGLRYNTRSSLSLDFAFGIDIDMKHFIMSPELRFSGGLTDIRPNPVGQKLRGSNAVLVLNFTGK